VHLLFQNQNIQEAIYQGLAKPLEDKGIDSFESYLKQDKDNSRVIYSKEIVKPIKTYRISPLPKTEDDEVIENLRTLWVRPKRGSYEGEKNSWSFRIIGANDGIITANILDASFLEGIKSGSIRLAQPDRLQVEIIERQYIKDHSRQSNT